MVLIDTSAWIEALRKIGITVSSMDILIFSVASFYGSKLISKDRHFSLLETLKI
jgi:predicted nucleic acid-binding protein